jgi:3-phosphoshikimate 1-carboxyvinyltransferase
VSGQLCSGAYTLPGDVSSQFISGLLFALPLLPGDSTLTITGKWESVEYIHMTLRALRQYGIAVTQTATGFQIPGGQTYRPPVEAVVEGDWSNAAFWLCAGALTDAGLTVRGLDPESPQGDKEILSILRQFGAQVQCSGDAITVSGGNLQGIVLDASDVPDLVPVVSVVAAAANGETRITGAARLRIKESDRLEAVSALFSALGGNVQQLPDGLIIQGGTPLTGGTVSAFGDHRIAMSAAVAAMLANGPVTVTGAQAVEKSYPAFWADYQKLGGVVSPANEEV